MCGVENSVIGLDKTVAIKRFVTSMPWSFQPAEGPSSINYVVIDIDENGNLCKLLEESGKKPKRDFHIVPQNILNIIPAKNHILLVVQCEIFCLKSHFLTFDFILPKDDFSSLEYTLEKERLKFILLNKKEFPLYRVF